MADRINILLVDDQPSNLLALESILEDPAHNLVRAESGTGALRKLLDEEFAVILLDVQMPDLDGFETAKLIRERERSRDTPIIFLTALSRSETNVFRGYELGAVDYIFKPFHPEILKSKVNVFVQLFRQREVVRAQAREVGRLSRQNELVLGAVAEGILGVDIKGAATFINPAASKMIGREADAVIGRDLHDLVHPVFPGVRTCDPQDCRLRPILRGDFTHGFRGEEMFFRVDGTSFPAEFGASPLVDESGEVSGSVITFRDITERRRAAAAADAERRFREAEAQNHAKDNFLATLSHELRTPMTSILGWVQFLRCGGYSQEELDEALETIETSARLQARLIDDMLDVSRIVLGKFQVDLKPMHVTDIVDAALTTVRPAAQQRGIKLVSAIEAGEGDLVAADATRMQQVIGNILSNAIKFTPGGREVELRLDNDGARVRITISDQGVGIEPSFLPHVFERLRQAEGDAQRAGLGLGLAIARHIVELHHGEIHAESNGVGHGARFIVTLPLLPAPIDSDHANMSAVVR